jgi:hypothetical protein
MNGVVDFVGPAKDHLLSFGFIRIEADKIFWIMGRFAETAE